MSITETEPQPVSVPEPRTPATVWMRPAASSACRIEGIFHKADWLAPACGHACRRRTSSSTIRVLRCRESVRKKTCSPNWMRPPSRLARRSKGLEVKKQEKRERKPDTSPVACRPRSRAFELHIHKSNSSASRGGSRIDGYSFKPRRRGGTEKKMRSAGFHPASFIRKVAAQN